MPCAPCACVCGVSVERACCVCSVCAIIDIVLVEPFLQLTPAAAPLLPTNNTHTPFNPPSHFSFSVSELQKQGVTLHMLLASDRERIPDVPAVYFCLPTEENVRLIGEDLAARKYDTHPQRETKTHREKQRDGTEREKRREET